MKLITESLIVVLLLLTPNLKAEEQTSSEKGSLVGQTKIGYKKTEQTSLGMRARYPEGHKVTDKRPAIIFFHGGGWVCGKPNLFTAQCRAYTMRGYVTFTASYRLINKDDTTVYECVQDAKSAVRWLRINAGRLGVDPDRIIVGGGSAGAHIAACTAIIEGFEEKGEDTTISSKANALLLYSPVLDTSETGYGADKMTRGKKTDLSPLHHVRPGICPTIVFYGTDDTVAKSESMVAFGKKMKEAGNNCMMVPFEGRKHKFFNPPGLIARNKIEDFDLCVEKGVEFLTSSGFGPDNGKGEETEKKKKE